MVKPAYSVSLESPAAWRDTVLVRTDAVAALGRWPLHIDRETSLSARIPAEGTTASGFDAGIACALGLMPAHAEKLAATLHAAYTPKAVSEVRASTQHENGIWHVKDANSAACWWLAACSLCLDGDDVDAATFRRQLQDFDTLQKNPAARKAAAEKTLGAMCASFDTHRGYAFGTQDGCMQGAYIAGHDVAVMYAAHHGVYFIGTFHETLGLENFGWSPALDDKGRTKSGPVHGSRQFVKCADESELAAAREAVRLPAPAAPKVATPPIKPI